MAFPQEKTAFLHQLNQQLAQYYEPAEATIICNWLWEDQNEAAPDWPLLHQQAKRLLKREPIQYVLGKAHFYGRDFVVGPGVLIPRRETEELVVWIRDEIQGQHFPIRGLDIGTGSGCIPISLALEWSERGIASDLLGVDIEPASRNAFIENAQSLHAHQCRFEKLDILTASESAFQDLDFVVSNPPYVPQKERESIKLHVKEYEPALALFVPDDDPLRFYRMIAQLSRQWLRLGGQLYFEIHEDYGQEIIDLLKQLGYDQIVLRRDMQNKDRMVQAVWMG
ncbi:MAG: peptide chain release factor N(5)-glutamine methyltransferase [Bacteroidota bacterium]